MKILGFVSAHTGNPATENIITKWDWIFGIPLRTVFIIATIILIKYLIEKWRKRK